MNRISDRGLRSADSGKQIETPLEPAADGLSPSIRPLASGHPQSEIRSPQSLELHIDELVLDGFPARDRYRISEAIESELTRLFAERGLPTSLSRKREVAGMNAGAIQIGADRRPTAIGIRLARSIYRGLTR